MADSEKKKKRLTPEESKTTSEYYRLHKQAVDDLVNANEENSPEVSEEELAKYQSGPKIKMADSLKAILIKMWFAGSVCFFVFWGLSTYITARLDLLAVFGLALGIITDILTNNILRYIAKTSGKNDRYMMFPKRSYLSFLGNIFYAILLLFLVDMVYNLIGLGLTAVMGGGKQVVLGVGPILFGVIYTGIDLLLIRMKLTFRQIFADAKKQAGKH